MRGLSVTQSKIDSGNRGDFFRFNGQTRNTSDRL